MKAVILNSGTGSRMKHLTADRPKCLVGLLNGETILTRQLRQLVAAVDSIVITTGKYDELIQSKVAEVDFPHPVEYVMNPCCEETNYIYSIYLARRLLDDDILLLHGDLVLEDGLIEKMLSVNHDCMAVDSSQPLPSKDFKAVINHGKVLKVGIEFFAAAVAAQPLYKLSRQTWGRWLTEITRYCENGLTGCYAENALNEIACALDIVPFDVNGALCAEVDTAGDLSNVLHMLSMGGG